MQAPSLVVHPHLRAIHTDDRSVRVWPVLSAGCLGLAAVGLLAAAAPRMMNNPPQWPTPSSSVERASQPMPATGMPPSLTAEALLRAAPRLQAAAMQAHPHEAASAGPTNDAASAGSPGSVHRIGLNSATFVELRRLPHIGKRQARAIIDGRPYTSLADLSGRKILSARAYRAVVGRLELR
jgi:hypothetical protein